jgi:hypothetical protein
MSELTIPITPEMETRLREEAARHGQDLLQFIRGVLEEALLSEDEREEREDAYWTKQSEKSNAEGGEPIPFEQFCRERGL